MRKSTDLMPWRVQVGSCSLRSRILVAKLRFCEVLPVNERTQDLTIPNGLKAQFCLCSCPREQAHPRKGNHGKEGQNSASLPMLSRRAHAGASLQVMCIHFEACPDIVVRGKRRDFRLVLDILNV